MLTPVLRRAQTQEQMRLSLHIDTLWWLSCRPTTPLLCIIVSYRTYARKARHCASAGVAQLDTREVSGNTARAATFVGVVGKEFAQLVSMRFTELFLSGHALAIAEQLEQVQNRNALTSQPAVSRNKL